MSPIRLLRPPCRDSPHALAAGRFRPRATGPRTRRQPWCWSGGKSLRIFPARPRGCRVGREPNGPAREQRVSRMDQNPGAMRASCLLERPRSHVRPPGPPWRVFLVTLSACAKCPRGAPEPTHSSRRSGGLGVFLGVCWTSQSLSPPCRADLLVDIVPTQAVGSGLRKTRR